MTFLFTKLAEQVATFMEKPTSERLIHNLPPASVIVTGNVPYHSKTGRQISCCIEMRKIRFVEVVEAHRPKDTFFRVDQM